MTREYLFFNAALAASSLIVVVAALLVWRVRRRAVRVFASLVLLLCLLVAGYTFWYTHRPLPANETRMLFEGVQYTRRVQHADDGAPQIIHTVEVMLNTPGIGFQVTPGTQTEGGDVSARTTSQFANEFGVQLAINGDFFDPWRDFGPLDYYPHVGDPVNVRGLAIADGVQATSGYAPADRFNTLYFGDGGRVAIEPFAGAQHAISGNFFLVYAGEAWATRGTESYLEERHPRTAVGLNTRASTLFFVVVDGRQPNYSDGMTIGELSDFMRALGCEYALNLDGGGSATLVAEGTDGLPFVLNSPIHTRIPGRERPIANHLGLFAPPLPS